MKTILGCALFTLILASAPARAGHESHGGKTVTCPGKPTVTLDYFQASLSRQASGAPPNLVSLARLSEDEVARLFLRRIDQPTFRAQVKEKLDLLGPTSTWTSAPLRDVPDSAEPYLLPQGCSLQQAAVRERNTLYLDPAVAAELAPEQLGVLRIHEAFYYIAADAGQKTSVTTRAAIRELLLEPVDPARLRDAIRALGGRLDYPAEVRPAIGSRFADDRYSERSACGIEITGFDEGTSVLSARSIDNFWSGESCPNPRSYSFSCFDSRCFARDSEGCELRMNLSAGRAPGRIESSQSCGNYARAPDAGRFPLAPPRTAFPGGERFTRAFSASEPRSPVSAALSPDGRRFVSIGASGTILFDVGSNRVIKKLPAVRSSFSNPVSSGVSFTGNGRHFVTSGTEVGLREARTGELVSRFPHGPVGFAEHVALSPDSRLLAVGDWSQTRVFDVASRRIVRTFNPLVVGVLAFTPDSRYLVTVSRLAANRVEREPVARVWEVRTGRLVRELRLLDEKGRAVPIWSAAVSPLGDRIVLGGAGGRAQVLGWPSGDVLFDLTGHHRNASNRIGAATFSPDGKWIATGSLGAVGHAFEEGAVIFWSAENGAIAQRIFVNTASSGKVYPASIPSISFSRDGRRVALGLLKRSGSLVEVWQLTR